jgi:hypothetical protein
MADGDVCWGCLNPIIFSSSFLFSLNSSKEVKVSNMWAILELFATNSL